MSKQAIAYYRVSTAKQGQSGLGLESQQACVLDHAAREGLQIVAEFTEIETGTKKRARPQLDAAISMAKTTGAKLIIAKLDRLARNLHFITGLMESKVDFVACDMPNANTLTIHIYASMAEHEARLISERTKAALAAAKARGVKLGNPQNLTDAARQKSIEVRKAASKAKLSQATFTAKLLRDAGNSFGKIATQLNEQGYTTARGKQFDGKAVSRMLKA